MAVYTVEGTKATYTLNEEHNGIEVSFDSIPSAEIREGLKARGFRWHRQKKIWYARQNGARLSFVQTIADKTAEPEGWNTERISGLISNYKKYADGEGLYSGWRGCNCSPIYGQELKQAILSELKRIGISTTARSTGGRLVSAFTFTSKIPSGCDAEKFKSLVIAVVESFNSDHSNGMIDYFDRKFYDNYAWK